MFIFLFIKYLIYFYNMKKINLKGISEILSEKELKNILGGSGGGGGYPVVSYECCDPEDGSCWTDSGLCAGPDCETCMQYPVAQYGYQCWNIACTQ